jgi:glyoxylase-like metal-dependent hydrolase (beta-lactamase superfamily II)
MKRLLLALGFVVSALLGAQAPSPRPPQPVAQLAPGVFVWQGDTNIRRPANCTWIIFKDYVLVIDANFPWGAREILPEIKKTTTKPIRFVFNTHYHSDHSFGNGVFMAEGATIVASAETGVESHAKLGDVASGILTRGVRPGANLYEKETAAETRAQGYKVEHPTVLFEGRMAFDDGDHRVELIRVGPGHTIGDSVAWLPKEKILIAGDLLVNWDTGNNVADRDADLDNWVKVLDQLAQWDVKIVVPGHGRVASTGSGQMGPADVLRGQRAYLADMTAQVRAGIKDGKTADLLAQQIDLSKHQPWGASRGANASSVRAIHRNLSERK